MHTRFEHSLGTCWLAKRILDELALAGHRIGAAERRTATAAALLHDVTHVPFGHTIEDERRLFPRHDEDDERLDFFLNQPGLAQALGRFDEAPAIRAVLAGASTGPAFVRQVVRGTVCADLLDYLRRDAYHCGLALAYDDRLFSTLHLADNQLVVRLDRAGLLRRDALSELLQLQIRYVLTERLLSSCENGRRRDVRALVALASGEFHRETYHLRDDSLLERLAGLADRVEGLADVLDDLGSRRLYQRVYQLCMAGLGRDGLTSDQRDALAEVYHHDPPARRRAEQRLAEQLGVPESHIIIYCPSPTMALKEADVPVQISPGVVRPLAELDHPDMAALREKHAGLWRFLVCFRRQPTDRRDKATKACEAFFGHASQ